jgi:hypothetical protein
MATATTNYDRDAIVPLICERLERGEFMAEICRLEGFPSHDAVRDWCAESECIERRIARARSDGFDWMAREALRIADDQDDEPNSRRVRCDIRMKLLSKWAPQKYGDTPVAPTVNVGVQVNNVLSEERRAELVARRRAALAPAALSVVSVEPQIDESRIT